ncbi:hypothetical protein [Uliginosibacterium sediminicola]|uniref:Uncharacterized protein n=1 Tax=Uliginosibacterium sediminicola TaxID=2024550 RepID=A0ABU9YXJ1_9RHOO
MHQSHKLRCFVRMNCAFFVVVGVIGAKRLVFLRVCISRVFGFCFIYLFLNVFVGFFGAGPVFAENLIATRLDASRRWPSFTERKD